MKKILVVGSLNRDYTVTVPRRPAVGETVTDGVFAAHFGGKGGNQAIAAARFGGDAAMIAAVGRDSAGKDLVRNLRACGVDPAGVTEKEGCATGSAFITVCDGDNSIIVAPGANDALSESDLNDELFREAGILIAQLEIPADTVGAALKKAREYGIFTVLNPSPSSRMRKDFLSDTDLLIPNHSEAADLTGVDETDPDFAAKAVASLHGMGVKNVILTLGSHGSVWSDGVDSGTQAAFPVTAVDSTGAGDCFAGVVCAALSEGLSLRDAVRYASAAAAISVTRPGAADSLPTRAEVEAFLKNR